MSTRNSVVVFCLVVCSLAIGSGQNLLPITPGNASSGTIALPGQQDRFSMNGAAGQRWYFDTLDLDSENINATLYAPSGGIVPNFPRNHSSDYGPFYLLESGPYTMVLSGIGDTTGDYNFRILDVGDGTLLGHGTNVTGQLSPQSATVAYRFNGTAGQRLNVTSVGASSANGSWRLLDPGDRLLFQLNITSTPGEVVLPTTGAYVLLVEGQSGAIGSLDYIFRMDLLSSPSGGTNGFGTVHSGTTTAGQTNAFTYTAPAGTVVFFDTMTNSSPVSICLYDPTGAAVPGFCLGNGGTDAGPFVLPRSGAHRLEVVGYGDGDYSFRLILGTTATALTFGTTFDQTLDPGFRTDFYQFTGTAGQRLHFDALDLDSDPVAVRIVHPNGSVVFVNGNASVDAGPFTITSPGTYYLVLEGVSSDGVVDYRFRLIDLAQSPAVPLLAGTTVEGVLDPGSEVDWYRFSGTSGQRIYIDAAATNTGSAWPHGFALFGPNDQALNSAALANDFQQVLPLTGTYLLAWYHGDTNPVPYSFRALLATTTSNALTLGTTVTGTITQPGEELRYTFGGFPGQRVYYDALDADGDSLRVRLINPNGGIVFIDQNAEGNTGPFTLPTGGTYTLLVSGYDDAVGSFRFRLLDMASPPVQVQAFDTTVEGVLDPGLEVDWYRFSGTAGQRIYFDGAATNVGNTWPYGFALFGPDDQAVNSVGAAGDFLQVLPATGTYLLAWYSSDSHPMPYSFRALLATTTSNVLTLGAVVTGTIARSGDESHYTFDGVPGQRLYYDPLDLDGDPLGVHLLDPSGGIVHINQNAESDAGPFTLTVGGTYTLVLKGYGEALGSFRFRLLDMASPPVQALAFDTTVEGVLDPGSEVDWYRFSGTAGQRIYFDGAATNTGITWPYGFTLFGPNNQGLSWVGAAGDFTQVLPLDGTYLLAWSNGDTNPMAYSFRALLPATTSTVYVLGTGVTNALTEAGEEHRYTFSGSAGQRLFYDALEADADGVNAYIYDPFGNNVFIGGTADSDAGIFTVQSSGTHTLAFRGTGGMAGDYRFRLLDLAAASAVSYGAVVSRQLQPQIGTDLHRINGLAGQRLSISSLGASSGNASWHLYRPDDAVLLSQGILINLGEITLPSSGTYAIAVIGASDFIGTLDYQFQVTLLSSSNGIPAGFDVVRSGTTTPGQTNTYVFTGAAGLPIYLDNQTNNSVACHQWLGPDGQQVLYLCPGSDAGPYLLPSNGQYTLHVIGQGDGDFQFRWLNLAGPAVSDLAIGTTYSNEPGPFVTDVYRFAGTYGQRLVYDSLEAEYDLVAARLYNPNLGNIFVNGYADSEPTPFALNETGTHYLVMEGLGDGPGVDYSFRLIDSAQSPAVALAFDTQVTGVLDPGTRSDVYRFDGSAGQRLFLDAMPTNGNATWALYGPQNQQLAVAGLTSDSALTLAQTGSHLLLIGYGSDTSPLPYNIRVVTSGDNTNALAIGTVTSGALTEPGQSDYYTFAGAVGQRFFYDGWDNGFDGVAVQVIAPSGNLLLHQSADADSAPFTLTETGVHAVRLFTGSDVVGDYSFRLIDVAQSPAVAVMFDTPVAGVLDPGVRSDVYRFNGSAGQKLFLDAMTAGGSGLWYLFGPQNQYVGHNWLYGDFGATLPQTGQYLLIAGYNTDVNPVPFAFSIVTVTDSTNALALGATVVGTLSKPGESDYYTFSGTAGQRLFYDGLENDGDDVTVQIVTPSGTVGWQLNADSDIAPFVLRETGTHTLRILSGSNLAADYRFRLLDVASMPLAAYDTVITDSITAGFGAVIYQVPGLVGLRLYFDGLGTPDGTASYYLYDPNNGPLTVTSVGTDVETTPTLTGTYLLVFFSGVDSVVPFSFQIIPGNHPPVLAGIGNRNIDEEAGFTFTATTTDVELPNDVLTWSLDAGAPAGASIHPTTGLFSWTPTELQGPGSYNVTVRVRDDGLPPLEDSETFTIQVAEVNRRPVLTVPSNQTLNEETALSVTATATDPDLPANTLSFALVSGPANLTVNPGGAIAWATGEADGPGTYPVVVRVFDNGSPSLSETQTFQVIVREVNLAPTLTLPPDTSILALLPYTATATATDPDQPANPLVYGLISPPEGMTINPMTGVISWTPMEAQAPSNHVIQVSVTDTNEAAINAKSISQTSSYTIRVTHRPILQISRSVDGVILSWETPIAFDLYSSATLHGTWEKFTNTNAFQIVGEMKSLSQPVDAGPRFYRLQLP